MTEAPRATFTKQRLEAFSDGVLAIIITIMVLEMRAPVHAEHFADLEPLAPGVPQLRAELRVPRDLLEQPPSPAARRARRATAAILWANLHLLFWLSLIPFATAWMGENHFASAPMALPVSRGRPDLAGP